MIKLIVAVTFFFALTGNFCSAESYSVSPLIIDETLKGRDIVTREITLNNVSNYPITVYPTVNNISVDDGGRVQEFVQAVESDRSRSLASWIEISRLGIDLKPGEEKKVTVTFRIQDDAVSGMYHALIGFGTGGTRDEAERQVMEGRAPGVMVTIAIPDTQIEFLKLSKFIISKFVTKSENQAAVFTFTNPGDEAIVPEGEIILFDSAGKEVGAIPVNTDRAIINPGEEYSFTAQVPIDGLFGKYKAFLAVEYGSKQRAALQDTSFFYVFPTKMILIVLLIAIITVALLASYLHKRYFDTKIDDSERLTVHVRDTEREPKHHDIDLKNLS